MVAGNTRRQGHEADGYTVSIAKKQTKANAVGPLAFRFFIDSGPQPKEWFWLFFLSCISLETPWRTHPEVSPRWFKRWSDRQWRQIMTSLPLIGLTGKHIIVLNSYFKISEDVVGVPHLHHHLPLLSPLTFFPRPPTPPQIHNLCWNYCLQLLYILFMHCICKYILLCSLSVVRMYMNKPVCVGV